MNPSPRTQPLLGIALTRYVGLAAILYIIGARSLPGAQRQLEVK
jgi:hypothetical protein